MNTDVRRTMEPLELLDLTKRTTVAKIVDGMSRCSFGARMLGEVATTLEQWIRNGDHAVIIYDGRLDTPLGRLLERMVQQNWFSRIFRPEEYARDASSSSRGNALVVGGFPERFEDEVFHKPARAVFVNTFGLAKPGQVRDGYFPDVVFADPRYVLPVLYWTLMERIEGSAKRVEELVADLRPYGGLGFEMSDGAATLRAMVKDPECTVFMTISGAMTMAKMGLVICEMLDRGWVQYLATTGALMAHGLVESIGLRHYKYHPGHDDAILAAQKINRVTDTLEPEENLDSVEEVVGKVLETVEHHVMSPSELHRLIGKYLAEQYPKERGILKSAYLKSVPVVVPAFVDSEIGNDVYIHNRKRESEGRPPIIMDLERDSRLLVETITGAKRAGIFTVGGGVPRNNTQNVAPLIEIMNVRLGSNLSEMKYSYGCKIAPDQMHYGHLGGSTYSEAKSWRKMDTAGRFSEIHADATMVLPFLVRYLMDGEERRERKAAA